MTTLFQPLITASDYQAFRRFPKSDFPETFEMWSRQLSNQRDHHCLQWHPHGTCVDVKVNPKEFREFCLATNSNYTTETLGRLVAEKGLREGKQ